MVIIVIAGFSLKYLQNEPQIEPQLKAVLTIEQKLVGKTRLEQSIIKSEEIVLSDPTGTYTNTRYGVTVEIQSIRQINGGIEVMVKGWRDGKQLGFGDGSVEIERIRVLDPDVNYPDPTGSISKKHFNPSTEEFYFTKYREDPFAYTRLDIAHTVNIIGIEGANIIKGKVGNTTTTLNPAAGANEPVDGSVIRTGDTATFATIRAATGNSPQVTNTNESIAWIRSHTTTDRFDKFSRGVFGFDTSPIGGDTIDSVTFSVVATLALDEMTGDAVSIDRNPPANSNNLVNGDFDVGGWDGVLQSDTELAIASWTADSTTYTDFTLNATGEGNVDTSGLTWLGTRITADFDNISPTWGSGDDALINALTADNGSLEPKLVIVHTAGAEVEEVSNNQII